MPASGAKTFQWASSPTRVSCSLSLLRSVVVPTQTESDMSVSISFSVYITSQIISVLAYVENESPKRILILEYRYILGRSCCEIYVPLQ